MAADGIQQDRTFCDPCSNGDQLVAVEGFCQICQEYLCENCLRVHRNQRITRGHAILDKEQMPNRQRSNTSQGLCVEICQTHHPEIIRFYCKAHDETGCVDCMTLNHMSCKKDRVQDVSDGFPSTNEFESIQHKLNQFRKELELMKGVLKTNLKNMDATYNNTHLKITSFCKQVMEYLDQVQKEITDEVEDMKRKDENAMKHSIAENESMESELEEIFLRIHTDSYVNVNSTFVINKQAKHRLHEMEQDLNKIKQSQEQLQQYGFQPSTQIETLVSAKTRLGVLSRKPNIHTPATYRGKINVKSKADKNNCLLQDCMMLGPDRIVIIDGNNDNIKLVDINTNTVLSSYSTSCAPNKVTSVSTDQIAVTLPQEMKIQLLNVTSTFTKQREIKVNHKCYGVAFKDKMFAVSSKYRIEIIDLQGQVQHTIQLIQGNEYILENPLFISFGQDNDTIIVSAYLSDKVSAVTYEGHILRTYALEAPCGIAITPNGIMFVCSSNGNGSIHAVSSDFKTSRITIRSDKVYCPRSITYCDVNHRLYVDGDMSNTVQIYDLNV